jgi:hypothetical protein
MTSGVRGCRRHEAFELGSLILRRLGRRAGGDAPFAREERERRGGSGKEQHDEDHRERTGDEDADIPGCAAWQGGHRE